MLLWGRCFYDHFIRNINNDSQNTYDDFKDFLTCLTFVSWVRALVVIISAVFGSLCYVGYCFNSGWIYFLKLPRKLFKYNCSTTKLPSRSTLLFVIICL